MLNIPRKVVKIGKSKFRSPREYSCGDHERKSTVNIFGEANENY